MANEGKNGSSEEVKAPKPPAGFRRRVEASSASWFTNKAGNVCYGKLLGRYIMQVDPPRPYYQVELYQDSTVTTGKGEDAEEIVAKAGEIVNVGESFKIQCLKDVEIPAILAGAEYDVWIEIEKKIKIGGGHEMWVTDVQSKCKKNPTSQPRPLTDSHASGASEEMPF